MKDCSSRVEHPLPNHPSPTHDWETERYMERSKKKKHAAKEQHIAPKSYSQATTECHWKTRTRRSLPVVL